MFKAFILSSLQGDDDVFVNMRNIVDYLTSLTPETAVEMMTGSVLYPSPRITNPKYYVPASLYAEKYYPPYVSGGGFVMSSLVAKRMLEVGKIQTMPRKVYVSISHLKCFN